MAFPMLVVFFSVIITNSFAYYPRTNKLNCESNIKAGLQQDITQFHNKIRSKLARGDFDGYESGTNIYTMRWDCDLEKLAQERANSCTSDRELDQFSDKIGEITHRLLANESKNNGHYFEEAMDYWSNTTESLNQIISGETLLVGCGINECQKVVRKRMVHEMYLVCQYWPIVREDKLYKAGPSCETWQDCTVYNESVCYSYTKLCDSYNEAEIYDTFHTFLLSNSTINFPNLEEHSAISSLLGKDSRGNANGSDNNYVTASSCSKIMSDNMRSDILFGHNIIRSQLANGDFKFLPSGSNIYALKWSCELERLAQQYADISVDTCKISRKEDIHVPFETGQNIFKVRTNGSFTAGNWFGEALNFWTKETRESNNVVQILYGKTLLLGCGIRKCPESEIAVVCQYWPKAIAGPLYEHGSSCKANGHCNAYNQSSCHHETGLCQIPDGFILPSPLRAKQLLSTTDDCNGTKILSIYRFLLMKKHEEYRKNAANGIVNLRNFEFIEEDFSFKLDWNCELERKAQREAEKCAEPPRDAKHKYYRTIVYNFDFDNLATSLDKKIDHAISSWWGNAMDNDNDNIARLEATEIGCGVASCIDESLQMVLDIICRYWPVSDPNHLYSYTISCARDADCSSLPNSFCDANLGTCVEAEARKKSSVKKNLE